MSTPTFRGLLPDGSLPAASKALVDAQVDMRVQEKLPALAAPVVADAAAPHIAAAKTEADRARDISNIDTSDGVVEALAADPASKTHAAVRATTRATRSLYHLNAYERFFNSVAGWATGQGGISTTTTGAAAGATVIPVASTSGLLAGMQLLTGRATPQQAIHVVASVGAGQVTVTAPTPYAIPNGDAVTPLWSNSSHLGPNGYIALAYWLANAKDPDSGEYIITGTAPKVTVLGNSWISQGTTAWADQIKARIPGATVINAGIAGNTSAQMLARFGTDVPADSDYVIINEPGVNDDTSNVPLATQAANLEALVARIRALGAVPIYVGHVPLVDVAARALQRQTATKAAIGSGHGFPAASWAGVGGLMAYSPEQTSVGVGPSSLRDTTTGTENTALGAYAGQKVTSGQGNAFVGREAGTAVTVGAWNTAVGHNALRANVSGSLNTAVGQAAGASATGQGGTYIGRNAGVLVTSAMENVHIGYHAGYSGGGDAANATTTGARQTVVGTEAGQGSATQVNLIVAVGYRATASGHYATALGSGVSAAGNGAVAIGRDNAGTAATAPNNNDFVLGTALHRYKMPGLPTANPGVGSGILWNDGGTVKVA